MKEMGVDVSGVGGQFPAEHQSLAETPESIAGKIASEIAEPGSKRRRVTLMPAHRPPRFQHPQRLAVEIFRLVEDGGRNFIVDGVGVLLRRVTQGDDPDVEPPPFQGENLLGDEGFGQSGISLDDESDLARHTRLHTVTPENYRTATCRITLGGSR